MTNTPPDLTTALRSGQQFDEDGVMCIVSRQACHEAADLIEAKAAEITLLQEALASIMPPTHGIHGGPLCSLAAVYEDATHESSARFVGVFSRETVNKARGALPETQTEKETE